MPKVVYATYDELQRTKLELDGKIEALKPVVATKVEVGAQMEALQNAIRQMAAKISENHNAVNGKIDAVQAELSEKMEAGNSGLSEELKSMIAHEAEVSLQARAALEDKMDSSDAELRESIQDQVGELSDRVDMEREALQHNLNVRIDKVAADAAKDLEQQRVLLVSHLKSVQREAAEDRTAIREETNSEFSRVEQAQRKKWAEQMQYDTDFAESVKQRFSTAASEREALEQRLTQLIKNVRAEAAKALADYIPTADKQFEELDRMDKCIWDTVRQAELLQIRRVDWIIPDVSNTLLPKVDAAEGQVSWFSPKFKAIGARDLQIELRIFPSSGGPTSPGGKGNCALFLWGDEGLSAAVRFWIGDKWSIIEKVWGGRESHGTRRMCFLADQVEEGDKLRIGIEFMEVFHEHNVNLEALPEDSRGSDPEQLGDLMLDHCEEQCPFGGTMKFYQHINHRLLPQVQKEVERMQARLVRRVEWRLKNARHLTNAFPARDEPICSPIFNAAGVDGMQFVFYPSGYRGAAQDFASLFLYSPAGVNLKAVIHIGPHQFNFNNHYEEAGAHGRCNAIRFESAINDEDDTICIVLEVDEITQDLKTKLHFGPRSKQITSAAKLTRIPPKESLTEVKILPSLWTAKPVGNDGIPADGLHSFDKIKGRGKIYSVGGFRKPAKGEVAMEVEDGSSAAAITMDPGSPMAADPSSSLPPKPVESPATLPPPRPPPSPGSLNASRSEGSISFPSLPFLRKPAPGASPAIVGDLTSAPGGLGVSGTGPGGVGSGRTRRSWYDYEPPPAAQFATTR